MIATVGFLLAVKIAPTPPSGPHPLPMHIVPGQSGSRLQINFPPASHSEVSRDRYWLKANEPLSIDVQLSVDPERGDRGIPVDGMLMIDAVQVRMTVRGVRGAFTFHRLVSPGKVDRFSISAPATTIPRGIHSCALIIWEADGRPFPGWSFTIIKGSAAPRTSQRPQTFSVRPENGPDDISVRLLLPHAALMFGQPLQTKPGADGGASFAVRLALAQRQNDRFRVAYTVVALLDGRQMPFEGRTLSPTVTIAPGQAANAVLDLRGLPSATSGHRFLIFLLTGETPSGDDEQAALWVAPPPRQMGGLSW